MPQCQKPVASTRTLELSPPWPSPVLPKLLVPWALWAGKGQIGSCLDSCQHRYVPTNSQGT